MSNLCPLISSGFLRYFWTTKGSAVLKASNSLTTLIPLPLDFPGGLIIQKFRSGPFSFSAKLKAVRSYVYS